MPGGHDYSRPLPLVVSLHGFSGNGQSNAEYMHLFDSIHENEHLLLYPDGTQNWLGQRRWNATDSCCLFNGEINDVDYLLGMISDAIQNYGADPDGILITGLSNGGFMSHRMACEAGGTIRSIVALNGVTWDDFSMCPDTGRPDILHVHSTADSVIWYEGGSILGNEYPSSNETIENWARRSGCDQSWTYLGSRDISGDDGLDDTDEFEFLNCESGNRVSHWRINDASHVPPLNNPGWADQILDWGLSGYVRDSDGDGYRDDSDVFIYNPYEWNDTDGDGVGDNSDVFPLDSTEWYDTDGDGHGDNSDDFPHDDSEWSDYDSDGVGDNADEDDDNDGWLDSEDAFQYDIEEWWDTDGDGMGNNEDFDDDNDGWTDTEDSFPLDSTEKSDNDNDGIGDNADEDDDNDGWTDIDEEQCGISSPLDASQIPDDFDGDMVCDPRDDDDDSDGVNDTDDHFPFDPNEWTDSDEDGVGNNADVFPADETEWEDTDGDGVGDNSDVFPLDLGEWNDTDGDGVGDNSDAFPLDLGEWNDTDGDGVGDNADVFFENPYEWQDTDGDGVGDNSDLFPFRADEWQDTDGDGYGENEDAFPLDLGEWNDTDGDGVGDNTDYYPLDGERWEREWPLGEITLITLLSGLIYISGKRDEKN
jgi:poly(3-hydroxybutyrate) depolymerase